MGEVVRAIPQEGGRSILVVHGDLTAENVDAIVNAANSYLQHGGGVAGAIVRKGGRVIQEQSDRIGHVPTGGAAATDAGALPCRRVIHAVGPRWGEGDEDTKLRGAIEAALTIAETEGLASVSMPAVSSGIFGFPKERCATVLFGTVLDHFAAHPGGLIREVRFCNFDRPTVEVFLAEAARRFGPL